MSMHKIPMTPLEEEGLRLHGLPIGTPSQRSDTFRQGVAWAIGEARRLNKENERLKADAELIEWQPIETAPKDGTDILVMTGETMHVVRWINIHGDFDYWAVDDNKHGPFTLRGKAPTHWLPLPETPK